MPNPKAPALPVDRDEPPKVDEDLSLDDGGKTRDSLEAKAEGEEDEAKEPTPEITGVASDIHKQLKLQERSKNAERTFRDLMKLKPGERVLIFLDPKGLDKELIPVFEAALQSMGNEYELMWVDDATTEPESVYAALDRCDAVWSSWDIDYSKVDFDEFTEKLEETGKRMAYCPGLRVGDFDDTGVLSEDQATMEWRLDKMEDKLRQMAGFHMTTTYGTDLWMKTGKVKEGNRRWFKETGALDHGKWGNFPGGEIFTTPDENSIEGVLMLPVLQQDIDPSQGVDEYVKVTFRAGKIVSIDGGKSANKLRKFLQKQSKRDKNPLSVLQLAEFAFGANAKAAGKVTDPDDSKRGAYKIPGTPTLIAEKKWETIHVAFGSTKHGEEGTEGENASKMHVDFAIPNTGLTVRGYSNEAEFDRRSSKCEKLINEGGMNFF